MEMSLHPEQYKFLRYVTRISSVILRYELNIDILVNKDNENNNEDDDNINVRGVMK